MERTIILFPTAVWSPLRGAMWRMVFCAYLVFQLPAAWIWWLNFWVSRNIILLIALKNVGSLLSSALSGCQKSMRSQRNYIILIFVCGREVGSYCRVYKIWNEKRRRGQKFNCFFPLPHSNVIFFQKYSISILENNTHKIPVPDGIYRTSIMFIKM